MRRRLLLAFAALAAAAARGEGVRRRADEVDTTSAIVDADILAVDALVREILAHNDARKLRALSAALEPSLPPILGAANLTCERTHVADGAASAEQPNPAERRRRRFGWLHGAQPGREPLRAYAIGAAVVIALLLSTLAFSPVGACVRGLVRTPLQAGGRVLASFSATRALLAAIQLVPLLDVLTDLNALVYYCVRGWRGWASTCAAVLFLNWRFSFLYGVLHPKPTASKILALYTPGALLFAWDHVLSATEGAEEGEEGKPRAPREEEEEEEEDDGELPPKKGYGAGGGAGGGHGGSGTGGFGSAVGPREGEARDDDGGAAGEQRNGGGGKRRGVRWPRMHCGGCMRADDWLAPILRRLLAGLAAAAPTSPALRVPFALVFECAISALAVPCGLYFIARASLMLAEARLLGYADGGGSRAINRRVLHNKVLTFVEATLESLPQLALQTSVFLYEAGQPGGMSVRAARVYKLSAALSAAGMLKAVVIFALDRERIMRVLGPPPDLVGISAQLLTRARPIAALAALERTEQAAGAGEAGSPRADATEARPGGAGADAAGRGDESLLSTAPPGRARPPTAKSNRSAARAPSQELRLEP